MVSDRCLSGLWPSPLPTASENAMNQDLWLTLLTAILYFAWKLVDRYKP